MDFLGVSFTPTAQCATPSNALVYPITFQLYLEPVACHTTLVLLDCALAIFLRIVALREQHAIVSTCFLVFANTARLVCVSAGIRVGDLASVVTHLDFGRCFTSRFKVRGEV